MMMIAAQTYKRTTPKMRRGGRKRLSLIKMVLLRHLKAGFGIRAKCHKQLKRVTLV
jgi:hypothetical protein